MTTAYSSPEAPFVKTSDTSAAAAKRLTAERKLMLYGLILGYVRNAMRDGRTREEIELGLALSGNTVRPRVIAAIRNGDLIETERTRETRSGSHAAILVHPDFQ